MKMNKGFTLIELMVVLAVAAILITIGLPSFRAIIQNNRAITQANELITAINMARSEAIKRGASVSICSRTNPPTAPETCAGNNNWATGWMVFVDTDNDATYDSTETVLRVWDDISATGTTLSAEDNAAATVSSVRFKSTGLTSLSTSTTVTETTFTLTITDCTGNNARTITVTTTGRPHIEKTAC